MTRRQLGTYIFGLALLAGILAAGAGRYTDAATRRTYLLAIVVLYTMTLVVWILAVVLIRVYPRAGGLVERYAKQPTAPLDVPEEVTTLVEAIRKGRRNARGFESSLRPQLESLAAAASRRIPAGADRSNEHEVRDPQTESVAKRFVRAMTDIAARLRRGPSVAQIEAILDRIEEK